MALSNLRPGLVVRQERLTNRPDVAGTTLPAVFIGLNRDFVYQQPADLSGWAANSAVNGVSFPSYTSGKVESGVQNPDLTPKFFVQNTLGIGAIMSGITLNNVSGADPEIESELSPVLTETLPSYSFVAGTGIPTFDIAEGISATFTMAKGTSGIFVFSPSSPLASSFKDANADFVLSQVSRGDFVLVNGVPVYQVTGVVADDHLHVRRVGLGPESIGLPEASKMVLSAEDTNDLRRLTVHSDAFSQAGGFGQSGTKVSAGHILRVDNWLVKESSGGIVYGYVGEQAGETISSGTVTTTERVLKFPAAFAAPAWNNTTGTGTVVFLPDSSGKLAAALYLTTARSGDLAQAKDFAAFGLASAADEDIGSAYRAVNFSQVHASTTGSFSIQVGTTRTFSDTTVNLSAVALGDVIAIKDAAGIYRPVFEVTGLVSTSQVTVAPFSNLDYAAGLSANNVDHKILSPLTQISGGSSTVSLTYGADPVQFATDLSSAGGTISSGVSPEFGGAAITSATRVLEVTETGVAASGVLTLSGAIAAGHTVTLTDGTTQITYQFVTNAAGVSSVPSGVYPVIIGVDAAGTNANLLAAITTASSGVTYASELVAQPGQAALTTTAVNALSPVLPALNLTGVVALTNLTLSYYKIGSIGNLAGVLAITGGAYTTASGPPMAFSGGVGSGFIGSSVAVGDLLFSDTGTLMFKITGIPSNVLAEGALLVETLETTATQLAPEDTLIDFGFTVRQHSVRSDFLVRRVINNTTLEVRQLSTSPNTIPGTQQVSGFIWYQDGVPATSVWPVSVEVPDAAAGLSYVIEKTLEGADLDGTILVSYAVVRDDVVGLTEVSSDTYAATFGVANPYNPLGLALEKYFLNTPETCYVIQVHEDTLAGWTAAAEAAKTDVVYNIVPLTQDSDVLGMWRAHTASESLPETKRERRLWQSHRFKTDYVKAQLGSSTALVSRSLTGEQTVEVTRDLVAEGVLVGDDFSGTWFNGSTTTTFSGRITRVQLLGSLTTLTMLPDGNVVSGTSNQVVTAFQVKSRPVSPAELRDIIAAFPASIADRRVVNIFPDRAQVSFTDSTGFLGGKTYDAYVVGGCFYAPIEVAKRSRIGPALPLTGRGGVGIYKVLDTFASLPSYQDTVLDAGNYYMSQLGNAINGTVASLRALSTDTTDLSTAEESVTSQIDSFVRSLRAQLRPFLGPHVLDARFLDLISAQQQAVVSRVLDRRELRSIKLVSLKESTTAADTILMEYDVVPLFSGARGIITIRF